MPCDVLFDSACLRQPRFNAARGGVRLLPTLEPARAEAGKEQAAQAHAAHERPQQHPNGIRGSPDDKLEELKPDDFINEGGAAGADKQQKQKRQPGPADRSRQTDVCRPRYRSPVWNPIPDCLLCHNTVESPAA